MKFALEVDGSKKVEVKEVPTEQLEKIDRDEAEALTDKYGKRMADLADLLFYASRTPLLIVLQGMDTSGKDGTIRFLLQYLNAQSVDTTSFKVPTPRELSQDFLWRCHQHTPSRGEISIFNRSHYEDVLVVRVHSLAPEEKWKKRYDHIKAFESLLQDNETVIRKFFLHISPEEQEQRLIEREQETEKAWKLSVGDWKEREFWANYQEAYEDAINKTSTPESPWLVVPADKKWYRNLAVAQALVEALEPLEKSWVESLEKVGEKAKAELTAYRTITH